MLRPASRPGLPIVVAVVISSLLHLVLWRAGQFFSPPPEPQQTPPQIIEVALIPAVPAAQPKAEPPAAPPKIEPRKPPPVKQAKPSPPKEKKPIPRKEVRPEPPAPVASKPEAQATPAVAEPAPAAAEVKPAVASPAPYVEASYRTPGLNNPPKRYPPIAQQRGWEGQVVLKVKVLANGSPGEITVAKSSGHELLDEATIEQVRSWRFTPARRGNVAVEGSIFVPIDYKLTR